MQKITVKASEGAEPVIMIVSEAEAKWYQESGALHRPHGTVPRSAANNQKIT